MKFEAIDIIAYIGTALLLLAPLIKNRVYFHLVRIVGNLLWTIYGFYIGNYPGLSHEKIRALCAMLNGVA